MRLGYFSPPLAHTLSCVGINAYFLTWQVRKMWPESLFYHERNINMGPKNKTLSTILLSYRNAYYAYACHLICNLPMPLSLIMFQNQSPNDYIPFFFNLPWGPIIVPTMLPQVKLLSWPITFNASWFLSLTGALYQDHMTFPIIGENVEQRDGRVVGPL